MKILHYFKDIAHGIYGLLQGLYVSMLNLFRPKVTEQYPENRATRHQFERFRGLLTMPHTPDNRHRCTGCGICMLACPNGTIRVITQTVTDEATGKTVKVLDRHLYDLGSCVFCALCTTACPHDALEFTPQFEHAVFRSGTLVKQLNKKGSSLATKTKPEESNG